MLLTTLNNSVELELARMQTGVTMLDSIVDHDRIEQSGFHPEIYEILYMI